MIVFAQIIFSCSVAFLLYKKLFRVTADFTLVDGVVLGVLIGSSVVLVVEL